jgi:hypothetical protein
MQAIDEADIAERDGGDDAVRAVVCGTGVARANFGLGLMRSRIADEGCTAASAIGRCAGTSVVGRLICD